MKNTRHSYIIVLVAAVLGGAWIDATHAGLEIRASEDDFVPRAGRDPDVMVQHLGCDGGGTTSLRFSSDKPIDDNKFLGVRPGVNNNRIAPPTVAKVQQRDRDLGQTFLTGDSGFRIDAIYLRLGFTDRAVLSGALGAPVAIQLCEVLGSPLLNDSNTPGFLGRFDRSASPELDDYLEGETYRHIALAKGTLPTELDKGWFLKFDLTGEAEIVLEPNRGYAFVLLFTERAKDRSMALANSYFGSYRPDAANPLVGHGIRREGGSGNPEPPFFHPDLPDDLRARLAQPPGTLGFPDVCTWRDLYFTITAVPGSQFRRFGSQ